MDIKQSVAEYIIDNFLFGDGSRLQNDTSFLESGIVDSTGILELVNFLEDTYDIVLEDEELIPENLDSLQNIAKFIQMKINGNKVTLKK